MIALLHIDDLFAQIELKLNQGVQEGGTYVRILYHVLTTWDWMSASLLLFLNAEKAYNSVIHELCLVICTSWRCCEGVRQLHSSN